MGCGSSKTNKVIEPEKTIERNFLKENNYIENEQENEYEIENPSLTKSELKESSISSKISLKSKNYKLNYFDFTGRAELLRLIFAVSNTPFTDQRINFKDWQNEKKNAPLEQLPYLEVDDNPIIVQSMAIARYLAKEMNLAGRDTYEQVKVDLVLDLCKEFTDCFSIYIVPEIFYPTDDKDEIIQEFIDKIALSYLKNIEILIENFGQNNYAVGDKLTVADLFIHDLVTNMIKLNSFILENYPKLKKNRSQVEENENLKLYLDARRKNKPLQF